MIELNPKEAGAYSSRCVTYLAKGEPERALGDCNRAIELNPKLSASYVGRGRYYADRKEFDKALADYGRALELVPENHAALTLRGRTFIEMGAPDRAFADLDRAIQLLPRYQQAYAFRGMAYLKKGQSDRAIADLTQAIQLDARLVEAYGARAEAYLATNAWGPAVADLRKVLSLPARTELERGAQVRAAEVLTSLAQKTSPPPSAVPVALPKAAAPLPAPDVPVVTAVAGSGRRVALVIGNGAYVSAGELKNPVKDAKVLAGTLRRVGFTEVIEKYDVDLVHMTAALKDFGDKAAAADWAVIYFGGHGVEMAGAAYLLPTDAKLERNSRVSYETVPLDRMLQTAESAKKLRLVDSRCLSQQPVLGAHGALRRHGTGDRTWPAGHRGGGRRAGGLLHQAWHHRARQRRRQQSLRSGAGREHADPQCRHSRNVRARAGCGAPHHQRSAGALHLRLDRRRLALLRFGQIAETAVRKAAAAQAQTGAEAVAAVRSGSSGDPVFDQKVAFSVKQASFPIPPAGATVADRTFHVAYIYH